MKWTKCFTLVILTLLMTTRPSFASFFEDIDIKPFASLSESYTDNVYLVNDDEIDDFLTSINLGIGLIQEGKTQSLNLVGTLTQELFAKETSLNNLSEDLRLDYKKEFTRYDRIQVTNHFRHADDTQNFETDFGRVNGRYSYFRNNVNIQYSKDLSQHFTLDSSYGNEIYYTSQEGESDSTLHTIGIMLEQILSSQTTFLYGYNLSSRIFDDGADTNTNSIIGGARQYFTSQLFAEAFAYLDIINDFDNRTKTKPQFIVSLTNDFSEDTSASLMFQQSTAANAYSADLFDSWQVALNLNHQLLERLRMGANAFIGEGEYDVSQINDKTLGVSFHFDYDLRENMIARFAYRLSGNNSNEDSRDYKQNKIECNLSLKF